MLSCVLRKTQNQRKGVDGMRRCDFPHNVIKELGLKLNNGEVPPDFAATLFYLLHEQNERSGEVFWQYYTTEATYEDIAKACGVSRETVRQAIRKQSRCLRHPSRRRYLEEGLFVALETYRNEALERASEIGERARAEVYQRGYADGYRDCRREALGEDIENTPQPDISWADGIEKLELSARAFNVLYRGGIRIVGDIIRTKPEDLRKFVGMGAKCYDEIVDILVHRCGESRKQWEIKSREDKER